MSTARRSGLTVGYLPSALARVEASSSSRRRFAFSCRNWFSATFASASFLQAAVQLGHFVIPEGSLRSLGRLTVLGLLEGSGEFTLLRACPVSQEIISSIRLNGIAPFESTMRTRAMRRRNIAGVMFKILVR